MDLRIRTRKDARTYTGVITLIALVAVQIFIWALYFFGGRDAFHFENALRFSLIVPIVISAPLTYYMARMSLNLSLAKDELQRLADTDPLTDLPNRRSFFRSAELVLKRSQASDEACALLVIDADYFKELNDSYGHATGDEALKVIADILGDKFRNEDLICRVGGEEFAVLLEGMDAQTARPLAQRVVEAVAASPLSISGAVIEFSVSCGISDTSTSYDLPVLFKSADDAMYTAKAHGRNRVSLMDYAA